MRARRNTARTWICLAGSLALWTAPSANWAQPYPGTPGSAEHGEKPPSSMLQLTMGHQQLLQPAAIPSRIAVGDSQLLDVKLLRRSTGGAELLLTPRAAGSTTLSLWTAQGQMQRWQVQISGAGLLLEQQLSSLPEHAQALAALRQAAPPQAPLRDQSQVHVTSNTVQVDVQVVEFKKSALRRAGVNLLSGGPNSHGFSFGLYTPGSSRIGNSGSPPGTGGNTTPNTDGGGSNSGPTAAISSAMNLILNFGRAFGGHGLGVQLGILEGNGLARVLAKPTLVAHTGQSASFLAGGEIPIPVPSRDGNVAIQYKEFGVKLQLTPTILSNERIALKVAPEASDLDFSNGLTIAGVSVPAVRMRRADTMVELADGESFIIGGLVNRVTTSNVNKIPLLGDLPILGTFFKNLNYSQEESELVIVVTPHLVHPIPSHANLEAMLPGARSEQRNAHRVWGPFLTGVAQPGAALPGFSH